MQRIDFFRLERPIQERFIASARREAQPVPLAVKLEPVPRAVLFWGGASLTGVVLLLALAASGFGELTSSIALNPTWMVGVYAALGLFIGFSARRVAAELKARRAMPYVPGVYLFPSGLVDARASEFQVRPLRDLYRVDVATRAVTVHFPDASFRLPVPSHEHAQSVERALGELRARLNDTAPLSTREVALLDPLADNGFKNPFSPPESMRPPARKSIQMSLVYALAGGAGGGVLVFALRGFLAEDALYRSARLADTREAYIAYTERGGTRPEVTEILLPRTELAAIVKGGSLEALEGFAEAHKSSKVAEESDIALQHALRRALDEVRQKGDLAGLKEFAAKHGKHPSIAPEVERAIDQHWQSALATFERNAHPRAESKEFFRRLFAYTAKHGNRVELRFRRLLPDSVERAEKLIRKSQQYAGEGSLPKQFFDDAHAEKREEPLQRELLSALRRAFPSELVDFQVAPPLTDSAEESPAVQVPTLLITHRTEMSGGYLLKSPRAALTGIGVLFRVTFQIPGDPHTDSFKLSTWNAPDLKKAQSEFKGYGAIYEDMAERAFSKLPKKYLAELLPGLPPGEG